MSIFNINEQTDFLDRNCFFDEPVAIARYEKQKHPIFEKLTVKQNGFFWQPTEVDLTKDSSDFKNLTEHEQHIFTSNLKRQILLDSVQGRAPSVAFLPICSLPELEVFVQTWAYFETIHSRSYTHIIRNIYPNPSKVFDEIMEIPEIVECAKDISKHYDELIKLNNTFSLNSKLSDKERHEHKKALWLCLNAVNALEGIRFYVSFICSWSFAELKKMEGNAKIIKFIARDENVHLAATQNLLKILPKEDLDFKIIQQELNGEVLQMFKDVIEQEKAWAKYLFKDGAIIGLNDQILCEYVDYIACKRMMAIGLKPFKTVTANPLTWSEKWIAGSDVQVAPQEVAVSQYLIGSAKTDVAKDTFSGFEL